MAHLLVVILDDLPRLPALMEAWRSIGVPGVTILQSAGAHRTRDWLSHVGLGAIDRLFEAEEMRRRTLLAAIEDDALLTQAIAEAERVVDGFDRPNSGLLLVLPVSLVLGLHKTHLPAQATPPPAIGPEWVTWRDRPVEEAAAVLNLEPTIVHPDTPLDEASRAMLAQPSVHVACVVAEGGRLAGLLRLHDLVDALFYHIVPEEFLSETTDLEHLTQFAQRSRMRTVADAMRPPLWVKKGETVRDAFKRMHEHELSGLPVVDEQHHIIGYINLLELLVVVCCQRPSGDANSHVCVPSGKEVAS